MPERGMKGSTSAKMDCNMIKLTGLFILMPLNLKSYLTLKLRKGGDTEMPA